MSRVMKKLPLPQVRKYTVLRECLERGMRGFLYNDIDVVPTGDVDVAIAIDKAVSRMLIEIDEHFNL